MNFEAIIGERPIFYDSACVRCLEYSVTEAESSLCPPRSEEREDEGAVGS